MNLARLRTRKDTFHYFSVSGFTLWLRFYFDCLSKTKSKLYLKSETNFL